MGPENLRRNHTSANRGKHTFSITELKEIVKAVLVLTLAFAVAMSGGARGVMVDPVLFLFLLPIAAISVIYAFLCHELAHKFLAQRYGCWAEFRYWETGLLMALLFSSVGFLFAAPGAVEVRGSVRMSQYGKISAAGPGVNIATGAVFVAIAVLAGPGTLFGYIVSTVGFISAVVGGFNLIPISPLDGSKILWWNKGVYISFAVMAVALIATYYYWLFF